MVLTQVVLPVCDHLLDAMAALHYDQRVGVRQHVVALGWTDPPLTATEDGRNV